LRESSRRRGHGTQTALAEATIVPARASENLNTTPGDTDQCQTVQGQVDQDTQRVAFRIGESDNIVAETGLYNLTQEEAPVLIHFGTERTENYLLVRLEYAEDEK